MNRHRNWSDPVEIPSLPIFPCFGDSLILFAAIPCQPTAYGGFSTFSKKLILVELELILVELAPIFVEVASSLAEIALIVVIWN